MPLLSRVRLWIRILIVGLALGAGAVRAQPGESVIDRAEVKMFDGYANIEIHFNAPINIESFAPLTHGKLLLVSVALPNGLTLDQRTRVGATEWMASAPANAANLYEYLRFDRMTASSGRLNLKFTADLNYSVYKSSDSRSVVIAVITDNLPARRQEKVASTALPLPPPPVPVAPVEVHRQLEDAALAPRAKLEVPVTPSVSAPIALPESLATKAAPVATPTVPTASDDPLDALLEEARQAMTKKDFDRAIALYTKISEHRDAPQAREALEFLGVARERKRQLAHAKAAYEDYLVRYPKGDGSDRVRQRLLALLALNQAPQSSRVATAKNQPEGWQYFGSFSQYYRHADLTVKRSGDPRFTQTESLTAASALISRVDLNARLRSEDWDMRARFGGGYLADFLQRENTVSSYSMLSDAYVDMRQRSSDISARIGRQYSSTGGVLGRFNGAVVGMPVGSIYRLNVVAGVPVDLTRNMTVDDTNRYFYGANVDIAPKGSRWQYNVFALQQQIDSLVDRRDIGSEVRYYGEGKSLFVRGDYDTSFSEIGSAMLIGNWNATPSTTLNLSLDYRYNPLLSTRNALIGQIGITSITDLKKVFSEKEIHQLAMDRSQRSHYSTLSVTQQLGHDLQFYGSVSQFYYADMPASGGVPELPGSGNEYDYDAELIASNLWLENDSTTFGVRYYDGTTISRTAVGVDARYLIKNKFRINPRLWIEQRKNQQDGSLQWVYRPALRLEYSWTPHLHVDFEMSTDLSKQDIPSAGSEDITGNYAELGYWYDF